MRPNSRAATRRSRRPPGTTAWGQRPQQAHSLTGGCALQGGKDLSRGRTALSPALPASANYRGASDVAARRPGPSEEQAVRPIEVRPAAPCLGDFEIDWAKRPRKEAARSQASRVQ